MLTVEPKPASKEVAGNEHAGKEVAGNEHAETVTVGFTEYSRYDGLGLAGLVRRKEVQPAELVEQAIDGIERLNPTLNAVIHKMYDSARATARDATRGAIDGPFAGVPYLVKDIFQALAGAPLTNGSRFLRDYVPGHDSEIIRRMKASGLIVLGKTNVPEMGLLPITEPDLFGPTRTPWGLDRTPGGSSGGSAAAVASGMVPLAHASDGGGSIRIPAACCGLFGLKPTRARTPIGPDYSELWMGGVCDHVMTRSVRDSAAMLDALEGPEIGARYYAPPIERPYAEEVGRNPGKLRIAFSAKPLLGGEAHDDCAAAVKRTAALLEELGHTVEEAAPVLDHESFVTAFLMAAAAETWAFIKDAETLVGRRARPRDFEATTWLYALLGKQYRADELAAAIVTLQKAGPVMARFHMHYDVLLTPTLSQPPIPMDTIKAKGLEAAAQRFLARLSAGRVVKWMGGLEQTVEQVFGFIPYTPVFNMTGQPAMSVPLEWNASGLPIGMHFAARFGDEATLFRLAAQLEEARPWADRTPPVHSRTEH